MAGLHLLDPETGEYNFPYIRQYLEGIDVKVIHLVYREQGLIVQKGNPKGLQGLKDLTRNGITFINRQKGSGTRVLLDHHLKKLQISPSKINGYEREVYTHFEVGLSILSKEADVGIATIAVSKLLGLTVYSYHARKVRYDP
jgi:putative molybdopterin biosynthesis protein